MRSIEEYEAENATAKRGLVQAMRAKARAAKADVVHRGDYRKVFAGISDGVYPHLPWSWDTLITDPPFGARTHAGARTCAEHDTHGITYDAWTAADVRRFVAWAVPRTRRWIFVMTSHDLISHWEAAYRAAGWYPFAPVGIVINAMGVRRQGDGPSSWTLYGMAARSRTRSQMANPISNGTALWRALPGAYVVNPGPRRKGQGRGKPPVLLDKIVRDYSNAGDLVCDPLAGYGSTLIAALLAGRAAVGSELRAKIASAANRDIKAALLAVPTSRVA